MVSAFEKLEMEKAEVSVPNKTSQLKTDMNAADTGNLDPNKASDKFLAVDRVTKSD